MQNPSATETPVARLNKGAFHKFLE